MVTSEINLNEEIDWSRDFSSYSEKLSEIFLKISLSKPEISTAYNAFQEFLKYYVFQKNLGLVFYDSGNRYLYRTTRKFNSESGNSWQQTESVLYIENLVDFFVALKNLHNVLEVHKRESGWFLGMSVARIWERATIADFQQPVRFMHRMIAEIENGGLHIPEWKELGFITTRLAQKRVWVLEAPSQAAYIEGPRLLRIAATAHDSADVEEKDKLHSVIYGIDSADEATIYSIQLDAINNISEGKARQKRDDFFMLIQHLNRYYPNDTRYDACTALYDAGLFEEILRSFRSGISPQQSRELTKVLHLCSQIENCIADTQSLMETMPLLNQRRAMLSEYNMFSGGAAMISMVLALAILKANGIQKVRFPTYLPFIQHIGQDGTIDMFQSRLLEQMVARLQVLLSYSDRISLLEDDFSLILDISEWDLRLQSVNKKNRQIVPLLEQLTDKGSTYL